MSALESSRPHDRPDPAELAEAVAEFLAAPGDGDRDRLHRRVAANVLAVLGRELQASGEDEARHRERLAAFAVPDNAALAELAATLEESDPRYPALTAALAEWAAQKVAIVNPRYLEQ